MTKLIRNMSDPRSREFWQGVERSAAALKNQPMWMRAGIDLDERHYETYRSPDTQPLERAHHTQRATNMTVSISWSPNPLNSVVTLDAEGVAKLRDNIRIDMLQGLIHKTQSVLQVMMLSNTLLTLDEMVELRTEAFLRALKRSHTGDCICQPQRCYKCWAEETLQISTLPDLSKYQANKIAWAFDQEGMYSLDEALQRLDDYNPTPWPGNAELWAQCLPRWKKEAKEAREWLIRYRDAYSPSEP